MKIGLKVVTAEEVSVAKGENLVTNNATDTVAMSSPVNSPTSREKFQICCTDMYLIRFQPNFAVFCVVCEFCGSATGTKYQKL